MDRQKDTETLQHTNSTPDCFFSVTLFHTSQPQFIVKFLKAFLPVRHFS